jgi:hypothetical protein
MIDLFPADLLDSLVVGGHTGYGKELRESTGETGEGGIGVPWILALVLLAGGTAGLLIWLSPSARAKLKKVGPGVLIAAVMATPLIVWATTSAGDDKILIVERATSRAGTPELIVSLSEDDQNNLETTNGKRAVRVTCHDREGDVVLEGNQTWPFKNERGYDYPHAHQAATSEQLRRAERCRLEGPRVPLVAEVEGAERPRSETFDREED